MMGMIKVMRKEEQEREVLVPIWLGGASRGLMAEHPDNRGEQTPRRPKNETSTGGANSSITQMTRDNVPLPR